MIKTIKWLWAVYRLRRAYLEALFSVRQKIINDVRPPIKGDPGVVIAHPDAFFHITNQDVDRAIGK